MKLIYFFSAGDCKKRWRNIRDTYIKRKKNLKSTPESFQSNKPPRWSLVSQLSFLDTVLQEKEYINLKKPCFFA